MLQRASVVQDLGIFYSSSLSFEHHINSTVNRALKVFGFIKRNTKCLKSTLCSIFFSLVRLLLEFGVVVWHLYLAKDQLCLERVQNTFLEFAAFILVIPIAQHNYSYIREVVYVQTLS